MQHAFEKDLNAWVSQLQYVPPKLFRGSTGTKERYEHAKDNLQTFWAGDLAQKTGIFSSEVIYPLLLSYTGKKYADVQSVISEMFEHIKILPIKKKSFSSRWVYNPEKLRDLYKSEFMATYGSQLKQYYNIVENYHLLHTELLKRINAYNRNISEEHYIGGRKEFIKLAESASYKESIGIALKCLAADILNAPSHWQGQDYQSPKWLSDRIANLLADAFEKSGCVSAERMLELLSGNGYNGQGQYLFDVLDSLHTTQLWPRSSVCPQREDSHNAAAVPNSERIGNWTDEWCKTSGAPDKVTLSKIRDRFVRAILVPGNALYTFEGITAFEEAYLSSSNKAGLHLYAGEGKNWKHLPSPYFETKWRSGDEKIRGEEKERNKGYRELFDRALAANMIYYNKTEKLYFITVTDNTNNKAEIPVGDITGEENDPQYIKLAQNMFIHMFTYRDIVRNCLDKS